MSKVKKVGKLLRVSVICAFMLALIFSVSQFGTRTAEATVRNMSVHLVNVGGAGFIVELPDGKNMVVDAGVTADKQVFFDKLDSLGITTIDYLVGTHQHVDHISNFDSIINNYNVGKIVFPDNSPDDSTYYSDMAAAANNHGVTIKRVNAGGNIFPDVTLSNGLTLKTFVYSPSATADYSGDYDPVANPAAYVNSYSLVFNIKYGTRGILFTGDGMPPTQQDVIANYPLTDIQAVVAPHHGWNGSQDPNFWDFLQSKSFNTILIPNMNATGSVNTFKSDIQTNRKADFRYYSSYANQDFYYRTDGSTWWPKSGSTAEFQDPTWSP
jgi:beta-lactamase superfamily II metal-dependent hydrolase